MDMHPVPSPCRVRKVGALAPQHWLVRKKSYVNKVPALNHEVLDEPVEVDALEASRDPAALELASAELSEVLSRLGHHVGIQFHDDPANLHISDRDVEEDDRIFVIPHLSLNLIPCRHFQKSKWFVAVKTYTAAVRHGRQGKVSVKPLLVRITQSATKPSDG